MAGLAAEAALVHLGVVCRAVEAVGMRLSTSTILKAIANLLVLII